MNKVTSDDLGATWSSPSTFYDHGTLDSRDPMLTVLADGTLICSFFTHNGTNTVSYTMRSPDGGVTWDTPVAIASALNVEEGVCGPVVETADGLVLAIYGKATGYASAHVLCMRSTDGGDTWTTIATVANGDTDGRSYQEPNLVLLSNGELLCLIRASDNVLYIARSADLGVTWGALSAEFANNGRPAVHQATNGALVCVYRSLTGGRVAFRTSWDLGVTWSFESWIAQAGNTMAYAQMAEVSPNLLAVFYALEQSSTNADLGFSYLRPYERADPLA